MDSVAAAFRPVIHREGGTYWAEIPAMPGCFTVADTLSELKPNLVEAIRCWLMTQGDASRSCVRSDRREMAMA